ncbi:twin-arginine translocase TatA/TatE family subunit [Paenibacillus sp. LMG 31456]|uniref:Sec-independent protein translocase protein TatA n=1 Tax=Paenibacillus foliorum TaxID=2654974 RepID=A0A972GLB2_9BACL|nr:twin-arginine translocase TatA/TatE family subunit [Paenibacillus foliorum]NOU92398.1 twin-arginine translocase TatA/TatE family subunit [Paenibacillus foliorum]
MIGNLGAGGVLLIVVTALVMFGPSKLPQLGRAVGTTIKEFRQGTKDLLEDKANEENKKQ